MPKIMIMKLTKSVLFWLNSVPPTNGISSTQSPRQIVTGHTIDYNKHCRYHFGEYVQTHEEHNNSLNTRTIGAIALRPTGNHQGGYYFMSLVTGRVVNRLHATKLPMPIEVITRVENLAIAQEMSTTLAFGNRDNRLIQQEIDDDSHTEDIYEPSTHSDSILQYDTTEIDTAGTTEEAVEAPQDDGYYDPIYGSGSHHSNLLPTETVEPIADQPSISTISDTVPAEPLPAEPLMPIPEEINEEQEQNHDEGAVSQPEEVLPDNIPTVTTNNDNDPIEANPEIHEPQAIDDEIPMMTPQYGPRSTRWNLREQKQRSYQHKYGADADIYMTKSKLYDSTIATPQLPMRQGLRLFGHSGIQAVKAELTQLHQLKVMEAKNLTYEQRCEALGYLMFLKRKRGGKIKGRGCADGRPQRAYIPRENVIAPTVATEAVFLSGLIDAKEQRYVAIVDIPGAFMQADMDPGVYMRIDGPMVGLLLEIDQEMYKPHVIHERGKPVIYVELLKALYGTLRAA